MATKKHVIQPPPRASAGASGGGGGGDISAIFDSLAPAPAPAPAGGGGVSNTNGAMAMTMNSNSNQEVGMGLGIGTLVAGGRGCTHQRMDIFPLGQGYARGIYTGGYICMCVFLCLAYFSSPVLIPPPRTLNEHNQQPTINK